MTVRVEIDGVGTAELEDSFRTKSQADQQAIVDDIASQHAASNQNVAAPADNWSNIGAESLQQAGIRPAPPPASSPNVPVDMARSVPGGLAQGIAGLLGFPGDAAALARKAASSATNAIAPGAGNYLDAFLRNIPLLTGLNLPSSAQANSAFSAPTGGYYDPKTLPGNFAQTMASFLPNALGPGGAIARAMRVAVPGAASETAGQLTAGTPTEPYARGAAGLLGGVGAVLATEPGVASAAARALGPMSESGAQRIAAERLASSATDPMAARTALSSVPEMVPGSKPTTFQASGDMGIGVLEREAQTKSPADFQQRRADQNAARADQLAALQPNGSPSDLVDYVKGRIKWLDEQTDQDVASATQLAQQRADQLGGNQPPESYGANLRGAAQQAADDARTRERSLWRAVDPNGDLTVNAAPIRTAAQDISNSVTSSAKPLEGDEKTILSIASGYSPTVPFRDIGDLRSYVSDAMRTELRTNGQTQAYGRLTRLRGAIEGAINGSIEQRAQAQPEALRDGLGNYERNVQRATDQWRATRSSDSAGLGAVDAIGAGGASSVPGSQGAPRGGFSDDSGDQGLPRKPTFDEAAGERLGAATQATRDRADTFGRGPVGGILQKAGRQDQYRLSDASVPSKIFQPGPSGFQSVQAYRNAVGDDAAMLTLQDYAASSLRNAAARPDGTLDPAKVTAWSQRHSDALRAFPDLQQRFRDASSASQAIGDAMAGRRAALDAYQTGAVAKIVGVSNPDDVTRAIGGILNSRTRVDQMRELANTARRNPDAMAGLRKGVADYIQNRFISNTEAGTSGTGTIKSDAFQTFVKENEPALRHVFSADEINVLRNVAADLNRSNRSLSAVKIPNQSNTAQDQALLGKSSKMSILSRLAFEGSGALLGGLAGAATTGGATLPAIAGWIGVKTATALRDAGMLRVDDILKNALLNPEVARALLEKMPANGGKGASSLVSALQRASLIGSAQGTSFLTSGAQSIDAQRRSQGGR